MNSSLPSKATKNRYLKHAHDVLDQVYRLDGGRDLGLLRYIVPTSPEQSAKYDHSRADEIQESVINALIADRQITELIKAVEIRAQLFGPVPKSNLDAPERENMLKSLVLARLGIKADPAHS